MWITKLESSSHQNSSSKFWSLIKSFSGKNSHPSPNQPISFKNKTFTLPRDIARNFGKQSTSVVPHHSNKNTRLVLRTMRKIHVLDNNISPFSAADVERAIMASKNSSAVGPDGI